MGRKLKYGTIPSKRSGRLLTQEDKRCVTANFVEACARVMGFSYSVVREERINDCALNKRRGDK